MGAIGFLTLIAAPVLGSFFGLLADRLPRDEPVLVGRSRCRGCGTALSAIDLVPIVSFLLLKGRCRRCKACVPLETLGFEIAAIGAALMALAVFGESWLLPASLLLALILLTLAVIDARQYWLPDKLTLPLLLAGLGISLIDPMRDPFDHAVGAMAGYGLFALVAQGYRRLRGREGLGLGDAKLFAACGAWLGWQALPFVLLAASLGGLVFTGMKILRGTKVSAGDAIPFGPFLAFGFWLVWLYLPLMHPY